MDTTTFIFVLIGVATAAAWPLRIAHSEEEFLTLCRHALDEPPNFAAQRRRDRADFSAWVSFGCFFGFLLMVLAHMLGVI